MGANFSKSIDYEKDLDIIFHIYPIINYGNSSNHNNNVLEKNIRFRHYIQKKIERSICKLTKIQFHIPEQKFIIKCDVDMTDLKIYYKIYMTIEFISPKHGPDKSNVITYTLLEKAILDRFTRDIQNKFNIKIDKNNFIYLTNGSIQNLEIHQP
jgi:hypothetical protein